MSLIDKILLIVKNNFKTKRENLERENVEIIGIIIDDLEEYYINLDCLIMPYLME